MCRVRTSGWQLSSPPGFFGGLYLIGPRKGSVQEALSSQSATLPASQYEDSPPSTTRRKLRQAKDVETKKKLVGLNANPTLTLTLTLTQTLTLTLTLTLTRTRTLSLTLTLTLTGS